MNLDERWYELYEKIYGKTFNRLMTIGTLEKGYDNFEIKNIDDIKKLIDEHYPNNEFYISLYSYNSPENVITWNRNDFTKFENTSEKKCILFRFSENKDIIEEETLNMRGIEKFMFIRRSLNLGSNTRVFKEVKNTSNYIESEFGVKPLVMYNGYNECLMLVYLDDIELENPSQTFYTIYSYIETDLNLQTANYKHIEPFSQLVPLPGTQNGNSRLYIKPYDSEMEYSEIITDSGNKFLIYDYEKDMGKSVILTKVLKEIDDKISSNDEDNIAIGPIIRKIQRENE